MRSLNRFILHVAHPTHAMQELLPFFKEYKTYAVNYMAGTKTLEAQLKLPKTEKYIRDVEKHTLDKGRDLTAYMPLPIYRIGRYLLLLNQIMRRTPAEHPDHPVRQSFGVRSRIIFLCVAHCQSVSGG